ncbi:MAG: hypothetical protein KUG61_11155, partial [Parvibaculaceae bacterium]|nr:hypothetical protein [Parvibaculaceae bacterium]
MTTTSLIRATTRAALLSTTALVATASGAHAFTYTVSGSQNSTFDLDAGDSLIIDATGEIINVGPGVTVGGTSGSITVETGGDITSVDVGIELQGLTADLTGGIIVESTATVTGFTTSLGALGTGILVHTGADISGGLDNSGTISGGANGVLVTDGASLSGASANSGTIYGAAAAIAIGDGALTTEANTMGALTNTGVIGLNAAADEVSAKGILVNGSGSDITGVITNNNIIVGSATVINVDNGGDISGGITNTGMIGQVAVTGPATVTALIGIKVEGSGDISGTITNSGTILAVNTAVLVSSAAISGGIVNSGGISGNAAIKLTAGTLGSTANVGLNNSGAISGNAAIDINAGSTVYGITNSGAIFSTAADAAIDLDASQVEGDITNSGRIGANVGATVLNDVGIDFYDTDSSGGIINTGIIAGTDIAISLDLGSDLSGAITNNTGGTIGTFTGATAAQQATTGILVFRGSSVAGGIDNTGTIFGTAKGIYLGEDSTLGATATAGIVNNALGLISGGTTGIDIDKSTVLGGISNTGTIVGGNVGIALSNNDSAGSATIVASLTNVLGGDIAGANTAIAVLSGSQITGVLSNAGTIGNATAGAGIASYGVVVDGASSDIVGGINNTNIIKGGTAAIEVADNADITGGITNSGEIFGSAVAIHVITGGEINGITNTSTGIIGRNAGTTVAATTAILVDGTTTASDINGTITNAGIIEGTLHGISLIGNGDITGGISNSAGGLIQGLAGDAISVAAGSTIGTTAGTGISNAAATASKGILGALNGIDIAGSVEGGI